MIEANTFNDGTTIATAVADMDDMIFKGRVDESEVGKIRPGMHLLVGSAPSRRRSRRHARAHRPEGGRGERAIQFEIRAAVAPAPDLFLRANYSANADIVLDRRDDVLAIDESLLQLADGEPFVECGSVGEQRFERRPSGLGLPTGSGSRSSPASDEGARIKQPNTDLTAVNGAGGGGRRAG